MIVLSALIFVAFTGCEKEDSNPIASTPKPAGLKTFSSNNVKLSPVYFSFDLKDSTTQTGAWDLKLTTMTAPEDTLGTFKFPGIQLNKTRNVKAKIVDNANLDSLNALTVTELVGDTDTSYAIGTLCLYYTGTTGTPPHSLKPYDKRIFVVETGSGKRVKFQMKSYYNTAGASGYMTFDYIVYE